VIQASYRYFEDGVYKDCVLTFPTIEKAVYEMQRMINWWGSRLALGEIKRVPDEETLTQDP
jgi:hypothetical protein